MQNHPDVSVLPAAVLAHVVRGDLVESVHDGHLVALAADGGRALSLGEPDVTMWPRSCVKPLQAVAMVRHGLDLPDRLMALAAASHNGAAQHLAGAREILALADLDETALQNTPDLPWGVTAQREWLAAGHGPERITQNCSGKHAAMLLTCVTAGWDPATYLEPDHPLQRAIAETIAEFTGGPIVAATVDGCGAPLFATSVTGLARAFGRIAAAPTSSLTDEPSATSSSPLSVPSSKSSQTSAERSGSIRSQNRAASAAGASDDASGETAASAAAAPSSPDRGGWPVRPDRSVKREHADALAIAAAAPHLRKGRMNRSHHHRGASVQPVGPVADAGAPASGRKC